jgi:hypothetical protein
MIVSTALVNFIAEDRKKKNKKNQQKSKQAKHHMNSATHILQALSQQDTNSVAVKGSSTPQG